MSRLVLTFKYGDSVLVGDKEIVVDETLWPYGAVRRIGPTTITVLPSTIGWPNQVRLVFDGPRSVPILRAEVARRAS